MKRFSIKIAFLLLSTLAVLMNTSCDREPHLSMDLSGIKALGDSMPTEALQRMDELGEIIRDCSEYERRRYDLLYLRLQDKADIIPVSDSIAKSLYLYFEKHGTPADRMEARYYLASVYRDLHDSPQAIYYFLKSMEMADKHEGMDSVLLANACSQLSYLYNRQYDYEASLRMTLKEMDIAEKMNRLDAKRIMDVATAYYYIDDTINTVKYQNLALDALRKERSEMEFADVVAELVWNYMNLGMIDKADTCIRMLAEVPVPLRPHNYNIAMAIYHQGVSQTDSAIHYYKKDYESGDLTGKYDGARILAELYYERKDYENAAYYGQRFIDAERAYRKRLRHEQATNVQNEYQYNRDREEEAAAYKAASEARSRWLWTLAATFVLIITGILAFLTQRLRFANRERRRLEEIIAKDRELEDNRKNISQKNFLLGQLEAQIKESVGRQQELEQTMREKDAEIADMDRELKVKNAYLAEKSNELQAIEEQLREKEALLLQKIEQNGRLFKYAFSENIKSHAEDIKEKLNQASSGQYKLADKDWKQIISATDKLYPDFHDSLMQKVKNLTDDKIKICYLMKAGMTNPQIVKITGYKSTTVWRKVKSLNEALGGNLTHL